MKCRPLLNKGRFFYLKGGNKMIEIINLSKEFIVNNEKLKVLDNINLDIAEGDIFGVIGFSGAGKSTLLKILAGIEKIDDGNIFINDIDVSSLKGRQARDFKKNIGVVFQGYHLLNQKNVYDNIAFPLKIHKWSKEDIDKRVKELLKIIHLEEKIYSYPSTLSGGQKQRVAIARAIALRPKLLLLDELTSALDPYTTREILQLLKSINQEEKVTMLLITHEMNVIKKLANKVALLHDGVILEQGKKDYVLSNPKSSVMKQMLTIEEEEL